MFTGFFISFWLCGFQSVLLPCSCSQMLLRNRLNMGSDHTAIYFHGRNVRTGRVSIRLFRYQCTLQSVFYHNSGNGAFYCLSQICNGVTCIRTIRTSCSHSVRTVRFKCERCEHDATLLHFSEPYFIHLPYCTRQKLPSSVAISPLCNVLVDFKFHCFSNL